MDIKFDVSSIVGAIMFIVNSDVNDSFEFSFGSETWIFFIFSLFSFPFRSNGMLLSDVILRFYGFQI
jgi:hypothetical protein